jgi:hypothetical protein
MNARSVNHEARLTFIEDVLIELVKRIEPDLVTNLSTTIQSMCENWRLLP